MKRIPIISGLCLGVALLTTGCAALYERRPNQGRYDYWNTEAGHMGPGDRYYIGSKFDWWMISGGTATAVGLGCIDMPFSFVGDTLLLPLDFTLSRRAAGSSEATILPPNQAPHR